MNKLEAARMLARLNEREDAITAYKLALQEGIDPAEQMEAAAYILQYGGNYKVSYTTFINLYNQGYCREDIFPLIEKIFYEPNIRLLQRRYDRNCKLLKKYPYIFRTDFIPFEDLPIRFFPYDDDHGYVPYYVDEERFGEYVNVKNTVVSRNFFKDLEKPILAEDVYSQYELEYLRDNVRRSEDVARENHVYLHYTSWPVFCSYLACLNWKPLLEERKLVLLFEEEISRYPIDFKEEFGIDYSQFTLQPVRVREVTRLIWHTQFSTHNGGDFFNEIFDAHPNLLCLPSMMLSNAEKEITDIHEVFEQADNLRDALKHISGWPLQVVEEVFRNRNRTDKDVLVGMYMNHPMATAGLDRASRIAPAVFFQPHFPNITYSLDIDEKDRAVLFAEHYEKIQASPIFQGFKYIKTFTPLRRSTTSHGASVKFMYASALKSQAELESEEAEEASARDKGKKTEEKKSKEFSVVNDGATERVLNRSFMIDPQDRLYHDSVLVRFEDGKLNPRATFTALAAFLDLPYTESMTYCSEFGKTEYGKSEASQEMERIYGSRIYGFDTQTIYRTYDEYVNDNERKFIEYFLRDAYAYYGYDFHYYDGGLVDEEVVKRWIEGFDTLDSYIAESHRPIFSNVILEVTDDNGKSPEEIAAAMEKAKAEYGEQRLEEYMAGLRENRIKNAEILLRGLRFINKNGQPLYMMPKLKLDPDLLEQPLYH